MSDEEMKFIAGLQDLLLHYSEDVPAERMVAHLEIAKAVIIGELLDRMENWRDIYQVQ